MRFTTFILRTPGRFESIRRSSNTFLIFISFVALISLITEYGFHTGPDLLRVLHVVDIFVLVVYVVLQTVKLLYAPDRRVWLRERNIEYTLTAILILAAVLLPFLLWVFDIRGSVGWRSSVFSLYIVLVQIVILTDVVFTTVRFSRRITGLRIQPARIFIASFVIVIVGGAFALQLPKASTHGISFVDALFTSTSAVCVTGLTVVDTAKDYTFLGQLIIMILIQVGGLGLMTFTTFFTLFSGRLSIRERVMLQDMLSREHLGEVRQTLKSIIGVTFLIEAIGAVFLFISWPMGDFPTLQSRMFSAIFHSVSAFCNAGFALFTDNLAAPGVAMNPAINITIASLIVLGGLGFLTIVNVVSGRPWARVRSTPQHRLTTHSRLVLATTGILIFGGAVVLLFWEANASLAGLAWWEKILAATFQSVTARTAGFNTINIGAMAAPGTLIIILLMFIGASPASTGGGIKTTTASVLMLNAMNHIRGKKSIEIGARTVPQSVIDRAQAVLLFGLMQVFISVLLLSWLEPFKFVDLLFETVSAMATVGLSRGITASLSEGSKIVLIFTMLIGRVGALTLMQALVTPAPLGRYEYPAESVIVG